MRNKSSTANRGDKQNTATKMRVGTVHGLLIMHRSCDTTFCGRCCLQNLCRADCSLHGPHL